MKITVLGGSPKGMKSVTMQYIRFLELQYPEVEFEVLQPAFRIRRLELNSELFDKMVETVRLSDAVLWAFPLYVHSVCSQYLRFIELIDERNAVSAFKGKPAASLSTSIHFFDHTAHDFIRAVMEDLEMSFIDSHSAKMDDIIKPEGQASLKGFFDIFLDSIKNGYLATRVSPRLDPGEKTAASRLMSVPEALIEVEPVKTGKIITIITDGTEGNLETIIERFCSAFEDNVEIVNLRKIKIAGGCMGCLHCGPKNICRYGNTDEVVQTYLDKVHPADVIVIAAGITGRWYSSLMKAFIDRGFFHTHQPFLDGKQVAILFDGNIAANPALREGITGYVEWQGGNLNGIVTTEDFDSAVIALARRVILALEKNYQRPATFLGVAGLNLFRDEIYMQLSIVFSADYRYYRKSGIYKTLPHKQPLRLFMFRFLGIIAAIPPIRRWFVKNMKDLMLRPYQGVLKKRPPVTGQPL